MTRCGKHRRLFSGPIEAQYAVLRERRIQLAKSGLAGHLSHRSRQFHRAISRLAAAGANRPPVQREQQAFFRSDVDDFYDTNPNGIVGGNSLPSVDRVFRRRTFTEELGETAELSPSLINNARAQFQLASPITQFIPVDLRNPVFGSHFDRRNVHFRNITVRPADESTV